MGKLAQNPAIDADWVPAGERSGTDNIGKTEYRDAVACLYGISELSPRIAHQLVRKIIGIYRSLAAIADIQSE
jgi:hypothetical protein